MKKFIFTSIFFIILGFIIGNLIFTNKKELLRSINKKDNYYFLLEGTYSNKEIINDKMFKNSIIEVENNKYYVYLGITKDKKLAKKIQKIYLNKGINTSIIEKNINNDYEFKNNLVQLDLLVNSTNEDLEIIKIEEVVLAKYDELINNSINEVDLSE